MKTLKINDLIDKYFDVEMVFKVKRFLKQLQLETSIQESTLVFLQNQVSLLRRISDQNKLFCLQICLMNMELINYFYLFTRFLQSYQLTGNKKNRRDYECVRSLGFDVPCK